MTEEIFRCDAYVQKCDAKVTGVDEQGIRLDRTIFYPTGGGQPGDTGTLLLPGGESIRIVDTRKGEQAGEIVHLTQEPVAEAIVGSSVVAQIDWDRRYLLMRTHTCLHLLGAVIPAGVTGGSVREGSGRLDFDLPESTLDKDHITAELNRLIAEDHPIGTRWITDEELSAQPELVRTMSVKPPSGQGRVRLLHIEDVDLQPCGGTHVARTGEVGKARVKKIEKKGKHNRRVNVVLD